MKRVNIICEGQTEKEFCDDLLYPYFLNKNIIIQPIILKKSGGGIIHWDAIKKQIHTHLNQDSNAFVSTFIDFYGIKPRHQFPNWDMAVNRHDKAKKVDSIQDGMLESIDSDLRHRFVPYIQLHEFEALLFVEVEPFLQHIPEEDFSDIDEFHKILHEYPNPEFINDNPENCPSKRLERLIKGYHKIVYGAIIAKEIGLHKIRSKSKRFDTWLASLENL